MQEISYILLIATLTLFVLNIINIVIGKYIINTNIIIELLEAIPDRVKCIRKLLKILIKWLTYFTNTILITLGVLVIWIARNCMRIPIVTILLFGMLFSIIWVDIPLNGDILSEYHIIESVAYKLYLATYSYFGYFNPSDSITLGIVLFGNNIVKLLLPLSLTLYIFVHREQKNTSVSSSSNMSQNKWLLFFVFISAISIIYGMILGDNLNNTGVNSYDKNPLYYSCLYFSRILIWVALFIISIFSSLKAVIELLENINIRYAFNKTIRQVKENIYSLVFVFTPVGRTMYGDLYVNIESTYQMLTYMVEKNMDELYKKGFVRLRDDILDSFNNPALPGVDDVPLNVRLSKKYPIKYSELYRLILKNHISLIIKLQQSNKINEMYDCVRLFYVIRPSDTTPGHGELLSTYMEALHELVILVCRNDQIGLEWVLDGLEDMCREIDNKYLDIIILIYKYAIMLPVKNNDTQFLTNICYSLSSSIEQKELSINNQPDKNLQHVNQLLRSLKGRIEREEDKIKSIENKGIECKECDFCHGIIYVLLQGLLKSIELSHYECTGFMVKFIVTNFRGNILKEVFTVFVNNGCIGNPYIKNKVSFSKIDISINKKVVTYCLMKLAIMLCGQQRYSVENKLNFSHGADGVHINIKSLKQDYLEYIFRKIDDCKGKYGLLFLDDDDFMVQLKNEIMNEIKEVD